MSIMRVSGAVLELIIASTAKISLISYLINVFDTLSELCTFRREHNKSGIYVHISAIKFVKKKFS